jgi:predicted nucleotidyltransferase
VSGLRRVVDARGALQRLVTAADVGELDAICRRHGVRLLGAFGSATRPDDDGRDDVEPHDLDIAVSFLEEPPPILALLDDLARLTDYDGLDLAVIDGAHPVLRARALVGVPLYEAEPGLYATTQMAALGEERDTAWLRALDRKLLAT